MISELAFRRFQKRSGCDRLLATLWEVLNALLYRGERLISLDGKRIEYSRTIKYIKYK